MSTLLEKLDDGRAGIRLYGIAPPKLASTPERLRDIAAEQVDRLRRLAPDGLVVYDIQDEPGRAGQERPFPFLPTVDSEVYARDALAELAIPKIVYRCVGAHCARHLRVGSTAYGQWPAGTSAFSSAPHAAGHITRACRWPRRMNSPRCFQPDPWWYRHCGATRRERG